MAIFMCPGPADRFLCLTVTITFLLLVCTTMNETTLMMCMWMPTSRFIEYVSGCYQSGWRPCRLVRLLSHWWRLHLLRLLSSHTGWSVCNSHTSKPTTRSWVITLTPWVTRNNAGLSSMCLLYTICRKVPFQVKHRHLKDLTRYSKQ